MAMQHGLRVVACIFILEHVLPFVSSADYKGNISLPCYKDFCVSLCADVDDDIDYAIGRVTWPVKPETKTISAALTIKTRRNLTNLMIHLEIKLEFVFGLSFTYSTLAYVCSNYGDPSVTYNQHCPIPANKPVTYVGTWDAEDYRSYSTVAKNATFWARIYESEKKLLACANLTILVNKNLQDLSA
ncbi:uncharacterized protein [Oscarella lobularis]|uniref:uncharacterized protein n=1 Tax=Oscarella lobularis TaxID=121494 RepID=UPI0033138DC8